MTAKKHEYKCYINELPASVPKDNIFTYSIDNVDVQIRMLKKGILIKYSADEANEKRIFEDSLKKAMLIYVLKFGKSLSLKTVFRKIDDKEDRKYEHLYYHSTLYKEERFVYSLAENKFFHNMPLSWNNKDFIGNILTHFENENYKFLIATLYALICSKTKKYESERFTYIWTALNGMYNFSWQLVKNESGSERKDECSMIYAFASINNLCTDFTEHKDKARIYEDIVSVIDECWDGNNVTKKSLNEEHHLMAEKIKSKIYKEKNESDTYDIDTFTYLFLDMAYYYRCNLFHADKPVKLFSFEEEPEIKTLKVLNSIIEDYIECNLINWFDDNYLNDILIPEVKRTAPLFVKKPKKDQ